LAKEDIHIISTFEYHLLTNPPYTTNLKINTHFLGRQIRYNLYFQNLYDDFEDTKGGIKISK